MHRLRNRWLIKRLAVADLWVRHTDCSSVRLSRGENGPLFMLLCVFLEDFLSFVLAAVHFSDLVWHLRTSAFAPVRVNDGARILVPDPEPLCCLLDLYIFLAKHFEQVGPLLVSNPVVLPHHL